MYSQNNIALHHLRNLKTDCFHCGRKLSNFAKGKSRDHKLIDSKDHTPLCVDSAYILAKLYLEQNRDTIVGLSNGS